MRILPLLFVTLKFVCTTGSAEKLQQIDRRRGELHARIAEYSVGGLRGQGLSDLAIAYKDLYLLDFDDPRTRLGAALAMQNGSAEQIVEILFDMVVSRKPKDEEVKRCKEHMAKHADNPRNAVEDVIWAICNSKEFIDSIRR